MTQWLVCVLSNIPKLILPFSVSLPESAAVWQITCRSIVYVESLIDLWLLAVRDEHWSRQVGLPDHPSAICPLRNQCRHGKQPCCPGQQPLARNSSNFADPFMPSLMCHTRLSEHLIIKAGHREAQA